MTIETIEDAQQWLRWIHHQLEISIQANKEFRAMRSTVNMAKIQQIELYVCEQLIDLYVKNNGWGEGAIDSSSIWAHVKEQIEYSKHEFDWMSAQMGAFKAISGPSDEDEYNLLKQNISKKKEDKDELPSWQLACEALDKQHPSFQKQVTQPVLQLSAPVMTFAQLRQSLIEHLHKLDATMMHKPRSPDHHEMHNGFFIDGSLYYAVLTRLLSSDPLLKTQPSTLFCLHNEVAGLINKFQEAQITRLGFGEVLPAPVYEGPRLKIDTTLIEELETINKKIKGLPAKTKFTEQTLKAIDYVLSRLERRNESHYFLYRPSNKQLKRFDDQHGRLRPAPHKK